MRRGFLCARRKPDRSDVAPLAATLSHNTLALQIAASNICRFVGETDVLMLCTGQCRQDAERHFQVQQAVHPFENICQNLKESCAVRALPVDTMPLSVKIGFQWIEGLQMIRAHYEELKHASFVEDVSKNARLLHDTYSLERRSPQQWPAGWEFYYIGSMADEIA